MKTIRYFSTFLMTVILANVGCSRFDSQARKLEQANRSYQAGEYDQAEIAYLNILKKDPKNAPAIGRLALIYVDQGQFKRATPFLLATRAIAPDNLETRSKLAVAYFAVGQFKEARKEALYILDRNPGDGEALLLFVETASTEEEIAETRQRLESLLQKSGETAPLRLAFGSLDLRQGDLKAAEEAFQSAQKLDPKLGAAYSAMFLVHRAKNDLEQADVALRTAAELSPPRSSKRLQYAQFKIQTGDPKKGRELLEGMVQAVPDYLPGLITLAELNLNEKKWDACDDLLKRISLRDSTSESALFLGGRLKLDKGDAAGAIKELERLTSIRPEFASAHYYLALAYLAANENSKCEASLSQAIKLDPENAQAVLLMSEQQIRKGNLTTAIVSLKSLLQKQPQWPQGYWLLAGAYMRQKSYDESLQILNGLKQLSPESPEPFMMSGTVYLQQKKKEEARRAFDKALELSPHDPRVVEQLVNMDLMDKQYAVALQRVEKEMDPKSAETQLMMAKVFDARQDFKETEAALKKALEIKPDSHATYMLLANLYLRAKQEKSATETLEAIVKKNPKDVSALMLLGMVYEQKKDYDAARDVYQRVLVVNPNFSMAINNLAILYAERYGKLDEAVEMARKLRTAYPKDPMVADTLGWVLFKKGQYASALTLLQESASGLPENAEIQFHYGMVTYMTGQEEAARTALKRALELNKELAGREEAVRRLAVLAVDARSDGAQVREILEKQMAESPDDPIVNARFGMLQERAGAFDKAASLYEKVLKVNPENVQALLQLAELQANHMNNVPKGLELASNAYKLAPSDAKVSQVLGRLAYRSNNFKWALSLLQETARRLPDSADAQYDLAEVFYSMGRVPEAVSAMKGALAAKPPFARADAARRFLEFVEGSPHSSQAEKELKADSGYVPALMFMAAQAEQKGNTAQAMQSYESVLTRFPDFVPAKKRLAILYSKDPLNNSKAFDLASQAYEAFPNDIELTRTFGILAYRKGDDARAASLLQKITPKNPDAESLFYLGMSQYRLKNTVESRKSLQRALELNLPAELIPEAKKVLGELK